MEAGFYGKKKSERIRNKLLLLDYTLEPEETLTPIFITLEIMLT